ncbi:ring finger (C3HC4 type) and KH domain containing 1 (predicted), partial [Rattus norvegicus]
MTECVPVPSSEHVAEIVGRQGCKIKALRAKTNTYIKTPVRGEEPVFIVTGRKEDVEMAKREILSAAEHFSL